MPDFRLDMRHFKETPYCAPDGSFNELNSPTVHELHSVYHH